MAIEYLVTTRADKVPTNRAIVMVDGTVPDFDLWVKEGDLLYDHHRPGGEPIQIDEMMDAPVLIGDWLFTTTQVDADACVAAAWLQLSTEEREQNLSKLRAIAWDCDHLAVPEELNGYADFAAQCVAALKADSDNLITELGWSKDRKTWILDQKEFYASLAFKRGTEAIIASCKGLRKFPGENGEAAEYWKRVEFNVELLKKEGRIRLYKGAVIIDYNGLGGQYIDPRCPLRALKDLGFEPTTPITLAQREVFVDNEFKGYSYTIGSIPLHPGLDGLDLTKGTFAALTNAERRLNPNADGWGGRKTVGGSGWNTPSHLEPEDVIDLVVPIFFARVAIFNALFVLDESNQGNFNIKFSLVDS